VAKQTGNLVIAISERRKRITLYKGESKYKLRGISEIITEASQAMKTMERYKEVLETALSNLTMLELDEMVTLGDISNVIQRSELLFRIREDIRDYIIELGSDGRLIEVQLDDVFSGLEEEWADFVKDYISNEDDNLSKVSKTLEKISDDKLLETENLAYVLGYSKSLTALDNKAKPKGYRLLNKISRIRPKDAEKLIDTYEDLIAIVEATVEDVSKVPGISKFKARALRHGIQRLKLTSGWKK